MTLDPTLPPLQTILTVGFMLHSRNSFDPNNIMHHLNVKKPRVN